MKYTLVMIFCLASFFCIAQETNGEYEKVILDGKEAYMSVKTGEIVYDLTKTNITSKQISVETTNTASGILKHVIKKGETLYAVSRKYNLSVKELMDLNELENSNIAIGQVLNLTATKSTGSTENTENKEVFTDVYTVVKGDTLYSISKKVNTSISALKELNFLNSNNLYIGQKLKIR